MSKLINYNFLFGIAITLLSASCDSNVKIETQDKYVTIDLEGINNSTFDNVFDSVSYIKLNLPPQFFIGQVDKLVYENERIYIFDYTKAKTIFGFNLEGEFVLSINKKGQGPSEYRAPLDFQVDQSYIEVLDVGNKIIRYALDGNFIEQFKLPFNTDKFYKISEDQYLLYTKEIASSFEGINSSCDVLFYNRKSGVSDCLLERRNKVPELFFNERNLFSATQENVFFSKVFMDSVYLYEENKLILKYVLDFGNDTFDRDLINTSKYGMNQILQSFNNSNDKAFHYPNLFVSESHIVTAFDRDGIEYVFYDIAKDETKVLKPNSSRNRNVSVPFYNIQSLHGNEVLSLIDPVVFMNVYEIESNKGNSSGVFLDFAKTVDLNDPPILVKYKLK